VVLDTESNRTEVGLLACYIHAPCVVMPIRPADSRDKIRQEEGQSRNMGLGTMHQLVYVKLSTRFYLRSRTHSLDLSPGAKASDKRIKERKNAMWQVTPYK
jgi:hypothetical protein